MTGLVELLDRVDRAVATALATSTEAEGVSRVLVHLAGDGRVVIERVCQRVERHVGVALGSAHPPRRAQLAELLESLAATSDSPIY